MIEEEIFYPACKGKVEEDQMDEAYVEHDGAKVMIAELLAGSPDDEFYDAKMKVLSEEIKHHVKEEERPGDGVFAQAREGELDMNSLAERLSSRKEELKAKFKAEGLPRRRPAASRATSCSKATRSRRTPSDLASFPEPQKREERPSRASLSFAHGKDTVARIKNACTRRERTLRPVTGSVTCGLAG